MALEEFSYTNLAYGIILRNSRQSQGLTQQALAERSFMCLRKLSDIENGKCYPKIICRHAIAQALSDPLLEDFPAYIEKFDQRLIERFRVEMNAVPYFISSLTKSELENIDRIFSDYKLAADRNDLELLFSLDKYIHARLTNTYPDPITRRIATHYRNDFMQFFEFWVPLLDLGIIRDLLPIHFQIFEAILNRSEDDLRKSIRLHLDDSLDDVEKIKRQLRP